MNFYVKLGALCALHADGALAYGVLPLLEIMRLNGELIIDLPYCRLIYTPGRRSQKRGVACCDKGNRFLSDAFTRIAEN